MNPQTGENQTTGPVSFEIARALRARIAELEAENDRLIAVLRANGIVVLEDNYTLHEVELEGPNATIVYSGPLREPSDPQATARAGGEEA